MGHLRLTISRDFDWAGEKPQFSTRSQIFVFFEEKIREETRIIICITNVMQLVLWVRTACARKVGLIYWMRHCGVDGIELRPYFCRTAGGELCAIDSNFVRKMHADLRFARKGTAPWGTLVISLIFVYHWRKKKWCLEWPLIWDGKWEIPA